MNTMPMPVSSTRKPLRLWPGLAAAAVTAVFFFVLPAVAPQLGMIGFLGGLVGALIIVAWWLFFSRAPWIERLGVLALAVLAVFITYFFVDISIAGGAMGHLLKVLALPVLAIALVVALVISRGASATVRRVAIAGMFLLGCAWFTLLRTDGMIDGRSQLQWRWTPTAEQRLLAQADDTPAPSAPALPITPPAPGAPTPVADRVSSPPAIHVSLDGVIPPAEWPGFRGADRNSVARAPHISTDWSAAPPRELWRRPIGPGWSSFAVRGDVFYTQEQRGNDEIVAAYRVSTGAPVWRHRDAVRFYESNAGPGPRATPTIANGRVYAFGATGILNALDAQAGTVVWSRNVAAETDTDVPGWGFSSSPLVVGDVVIVAATGTLAAYDSASGAPRWKGPKHGGSYSSPHLVTIAGVPQVVILNSAGAVSVAPDTGAVLWEHAWPGSAIVQPAVASNGDVLINSIVATGGVGIRRLAVSKSQATWTATERWTSNGLKPYFNDFVVHKGHAFGFDGSILSCINLEDGKRVWKGGRYGQGQMLLLPEQDLLLVLSEEGELALVNATPDKFTEVTRMKALEGKTWNHPVIVGDVLLVRNGEQMAAFRLPARR